MPDEPKNYAAVFNMSVRDRIGDDRNHGWGADDSMYVIEALITEALPEGQAADDELLKRIRLVVNPSQWRQELEKAKRPDGQTVLAKSEGKRSAKPLLDLYAE